MMAVGGQTLQMMLLQERAILMMIMFSMQMVRLIMFLVMTPGLKDGRAAVTHVERQFILMTVQMRRHIRMTQVQALLRLMG